MKQGRRPSPLHRGAALWRISREKGFRLAQRLDPVLAALVLTTISAIALLALILGGLRTLDRSAKPVSDNRILGSYTQDGPCFVTAATDATGQVWATLDQRAACQNEVASGGLAPYNPVWRLWGAEARPFATDHGQIAADSLARLDDDLWLRGDRGGLAVKQAREDWKVWLSQSRATGQKGPLQQPDIAAVSGLQEVGIFLIATTEGEVFRYATATSRWDKIGALAGSGEIHDILATQSHIWAHRGNEVWRQSVSRDGLSLKQADAEHTGKVSKMLQSENNVYLLTGDACSNGSDGCARVLAFLDGDTQPNTLLDTRNAPLSWTSRDIQYVATLGSRIFLAGPKGTVAYTENSRAWTSLETRPVTSFVFDADIGVAIAGDGFAASFDASREQPIQAQLPTSDNTVTGLAYEDDGTLLIASSEGSLWAMNRQGDLTTRFKSTAPKSPSTPQAVLSDDGTDLFANASGAILMDRKSRRYTRLQNTPVLSTLIDANLRHFEGNPVLATAPRRGTLPGRIVAIDLKRPGSAKTLNLPNAKEATSVTKIKDGNIGLITNSDDRLLRIDTAKRPMVLTELTQGQPTSGMSGDDLTDISILDGMLLLGGRNGMTRYDPIRRAWTQLSDPPVTSLAGGPNGQQVYSTSPTGQLQRLNVATGANVPLIGMANFPFGDDSQLLDALMSPQGDLLLLAGDQRGSLFLQLYDPTLRRSQTLARFRTQGPLDAEILSYQSSKEWLVRIGPNVHINGSGPLARAPAAAGVETGWREARTGAIVTLQRGRNSDHSFLYRVQPGSDNSRCYFRGAALSVGAEARLRQLPNNNLAALEPGALQLYDAELRRWFRTDLNPPVQDLAYVAAHDAIWAKSTSSVGAGRASGTLWQIPTTRGGVSVASCAPTAPTLPVQSFEMATLNQPGSAILHSPSGGVIARTDVRTGRTTQLFAAPKLPRGFTIPQRALTNNGSIWLAFNNGVLKYDIDARTWTAMGTLSVRNWTQITLELGTGSLRGRVVAAYSDGTTTTRVSMSLRADNRSDTRVNQRSFNTPDPAPQIPNGFEISDAWSDGSALVLRYGDRLHLLNRRTGKWLRTGFTSLDDDLDIGIVNNLLVGWSNKERRFRYQGRRSRAQAYRNPYITRPLPPNATPVIMSNGLPGYFTPDGALVVCRRHGRCAELVQAAPVFDPERVKHSMTTTGGTILVGDGGLATYLDTKSRRFARIFGGAGASAQTLDAWLSEPLAAIWPAKDTSALIARSIQGEFARIGAAQPRRQQSPRSLQSSPVLLFNPDEEVTLAESGALGWSTAQGKLPDEIDPLEVRNVGHHQGHLWWSDDTEITVLPEACLSATPPPNDAEDTNVEPLVCEPRVIARPPGGTIAYLTGDWDGDAPLQVQLQSGTKLQLGRNIFWRERWSEVVGTDLRTRGVPEGLMSVLSPRPDGQLSLQASVQPIPTDGNVTRLNIPGLGPEAITRPDQLQIPALDLGWLRYDRSQRTFVMGQSPHVHTFPAAQALDQQNRFTPFVMTSALYQSDGSILVRTPFGTRLVSEQGDPLGAWPTANFRSVEARPGADEMLDDGGLWQDNRFVPAAPGKAQSIADRSTIDALELHSDRRRPGLKLTHSARPAWIPGTGFAWDRFTDLGWDADGMSVMATSLGTISISDPATAAITRPVSWSGGTFDRLRAADEFALPDAARRLPDPIPVGTQTLPGDTLLDVAVVDERVLLATGHGLQIMRSLDYSTKFERPGQVISQLDIHRPTGLAILDGGTRVVKGEDETRPPTRNERRALADPVQVRLGPMRVYRRQTGYALRLVDFAAPSREVPALLPNGASTSQLAIDSVSSVAVSAEGVAVLATAAGHVTTPLPSVALSKTQLTLTRGTRSQTDVLETPQGRFAVTLGQDNRIERCLRLDGNTLVTGCEPSVATSFVEIETAVGTFQARRTLGQVAFSLSPLGLDQAPISIALNQGRFDHDRITHVAACHTFVHYFIRAGLHLRQSDSSVDWTTAAPISKRPMPEAVFCPEAMELPGIRENLLVYARNDEVDANFLDDPIAIPFGRQSTMDRYLEGPSLSGHNVTRSRIIRRTRDGNLLELKQGGIVHKSLVIGGTAKRLAMVGNRGPGALIDLPETFAVVADRLWAVTRDGLVPMGPAAGGQPAVLDRSGPPAQNLPASCRNTSLRTNWISPRETDLFCGTERFRIVDAGEGGINVLATRTPRLRTATSGGLVLQANEQVGLDRIILAGEALPPSHFRGGFDFDEIIDLAPTQGQGLTLISDSGWYLFHGQSLSLTPNAQTGLDPETSQLRRSISALRRARGIEQTHRAAISCLTIGSGNSATALYLRVDNDGIRQANLNGGQRCLPYLGTDGLREAWRQTSGAPMFAVRFENRPLVSDQVANGRFLGDTAQSLPHFRPLAAELSKDAPFCAASANPEIAIVGSVSAAQMRVASDACVNHRRPAASHADGAEFLVRDGELFRRRLP